MYDQTFDSIDKSDFLGKYWQKAPCLFKGAFTNVPNPLSPEEIAGLSLDDEIESRLIRQHSGTNQWTIEHGPLAEERFSSLPESHWTLLVQTVDHWVPEILQLVDSFRFLPKWRFDDVMVSYATEQGGVGPHVDNYDVFLVQTQGKRHWRVGHKGDIPERQHVIKSLSHVQNFEPAIDAMLEPGDMLYIPPETAHHGISIGNSIGYSVGYRAIQTHQVLALLTEHLMEKKDNHLFFNDSYRDTTNYSNILEPQLIDWAQTQIRQLADQPELIADLLGKQLSQSKIEPSTDAPLDRNINIQQVNSKTTIEFYPNVSLSLHIEETKVILYIEGEKFEFDKNLESAVQKLASFESIPLKLFVFSPNRVDFPPVLASLVNMGYLKLNN